MVREEVLADAAPFAAALLGPGSTEDGVVGWVESVSDGGCDVRGVSDLEPAGAATAVFSDDDAAARATESASSESGLACCRDEGSSTGTPDASGAILRRRRRNARGGKGSPGTDNQGSCTAVSELLRVRTDRLTGGWNCH